MTMQTLGKVCRTSALVAAAALWSPGPVSADAPTRDARTWTREHVSITFDVPETYGDCRPVGLKDTVLTRGVPDGWWLTGRVTVGYMRDGLFVVMQSIPVDTHGDLRLDVFYPPHNQVAAHSNGVIEYHVDVAIEVYDAGGARAVFLGGDLARAAGTLGPGGQDWDVFCHIR